MIKMNQIDTEISPRRYCFDISGIIDFLANNGRYTGIQRVVVMAAWSFYEVLPSEEKAHVFVGFYDRVVDQYRCIPFCQICDSIKNADLLADALSIKAKRLDKDFFALALLKKYKHNFFKYHFHLWKLDILAILKRDDKFIKFNTDSDGWKQIRRGKVENAKETEKVKSTNGSQVLRPGDVLLLLDAAWQLSHSNQFKKMSRQGIKTLTMVHDLIPLKMTAFTDPSIPNGYVNWLLNTSEHTTAYLAVSQNTCNDLQEFLDATLDDKEIYVIPLVQGFDHPQPKSSVLGALTNKIPQSHYSDFLEVSNIDTSISMYYGTPFILCVGTLEIRKNPMRLLQAWSQLIERSSGDIPKLVFAGRIGWLVEDFKYALEASGNLNGYIDIIEKPSDDELAFLYRNCLFTVMPSLYEGWGLPVGESLSFGKTAVISNNSSLPEVGQDLVEYCDPKSVSSISNAIWKLVSEPENRILLENKIKNTTLRNWHDVGEDLSKVVRKI